MEVYPAASLNQWGLSSRGYKGSANVGVLADLLRDLRRAATWLDLSGYEVTCGKDDDAFDAVVAAITARAAATGRTSPPGESERVAAETEGWIAVPNAALSELRP